MSDTLSDSDDLLGTSLPERYRAVRRITEQLCEPLRIEDLVVQSMDNAARL